MIVPSVAMLWLWSCSKAYRRQATISAPCKIFWVFCHGAQPNPNVRPDPRPAENKSCEAETGLPAITSNRRGQTRFRR